jgi:hypothetical protein
MEELRGLYAALGAQTIDKLLKQRLHKFLDGVPHRLIAVTGNLSGAVLDRRASDTQMQVQDAVALYPS